MEFFEKLLALKTKNVIVDNYDSQNKYIMLDLHNHMLVTWESKEDLSWGHWRPVSVVLLLTKVSTKRTRHTNSEGNSSSSSPALARILRILAQRAWSRSHDAVTTSSHSTKRVWLSWAEITPPSHLRRHYQLVSPLNILISLRKICVQSIFFICVYCIFLSRWHSSRL